MITREEALHYQEQLHPAFAGYIHDGFISERDCLAVIFHFFQKGILEPVWEDGSMNKRLLAARMTGTHPHYPFEAFFLSALFGEKKELSAKEIGKYIKSNILQEILKQNVLAIRAFPIVNQELQFFVNNSPIEFTLNDQKVNTPEMARKFRNTMLFILLPASIFMIIAFVGMTDFQKEFDFGAYVVPSLMLIIIGTMAFTFFFSEKRLQYDFENKVVPLAKKKYDELLVFMKAHPLKKHTFVNEFLPFAIAFGLDTSWQGDFGLEAE